ncbi:MAG: fumarate hydratase [Peptostreptococcaceae bacterium]|nr:fumarate hydratase [Peptostreptococcaceae bacterium]
MRNLDVSIIKDEVKRLFLEANFDISDDISNKIKNCYENEVSIIGKSVLDQILKNHEIAKEEKIAICQDTGMSVVFVEIGQDINLIGGDINQAINNGVKEAYEKGYLRKSVVNDPLFDRKNTNDNTPAVIYIDIVKGNKINIKVSAKGFGSENMSSLKMLKPADSIKGVKEFIIKTVKDAGPNPCPPIVVGVGIGGTAEKAMLLAKKSLFREIGKNNENENYKDLENELLEEINNLGIGPAGLGGLNTALAVNIEYFPTHIAGLPVAVNICCHASRHKEVTI